mgnify:CR=1 FL=1
MRGDMLLYVAALQQHVKAAPDLLPRQVRAAMLSRQADSVWPALPGSEHRHGVPHVLRSNVRISSPLPTSCHASLLRAGLPQVCH